MFGGDGINIRPHLIIQNEYRDEDSYRLKQRKTVHIEDLLWSARRSNLINRRRVFPFGSPQPTKADKPLSDISFGCIRSGRAQRMAASESAMPALMGHRSRAMLERNSHSNDGETGVGGGITVWPRSQNSEGVTVAAESGAIQ